MEIAFSLLVWMCLILLVLTAIKHHREQKKAPQQKMHDRFYLSEILEKTGYAPDPDYQWRLEQAKQYAFRSAKERRDSMVFRTGGGQDASMRSEANPVPDGTLK